MMSEIDALVERHRRELLWLSRQNGVVWGGIYDEPPSDFWPLIDRGLIERVPRHHTVGKLTFNGGYRITAAGVNALHAAPPKASGDYILD